MTGPRWISAALAAAVLLAPGSAATAGEPSGPEKGAASATVSGVTVTAPQKADPLADATTQSIRGHLPVSAFSGQYPRFHRDICVKVLGLPPPYGDFIAKRILDVAAEAHAPIAKAADCTPNIHVIFTSKPQALLDDVAKHNAVMLGFHFQAQLKRLTSFERPIQAWYMTDTVDARGTSWLDGVNPAPVDTTDFVGPFQDNRASNGPDGRAGSRLGEDLSAGIVHSLVIADANIVANRKVDTIADYVAVLALARWQGLERCNTTPTILNLLADGCDSEDRPEAATVADLALLKALYTVDPRELGSQQRATIASAIRKSITAASQK